LLTVGKLCFACCFPLKPVINAAIESIVWYYFYYLAMGPKKISMLEKIFGRKKKKPEVFPDIKFGRYSDNNKSLEQIK
jgi:hypothetical protein